MQLGTFLKKVEINFQTGCWIWKAGLNKPKGYPSVRIDGRMRSGHRAIYEHFYGTIPRGLEIHHSCLTRVCVNPHHMVVTDRDTHRKIHRENTN
jgi:hypothetical protein